MEGHHHMNMDHLEHHTDKITQNEALLSHSNHHMNNTLLIEEFNNILNGSDNLDSSLKGYDDHGHGDHILSHGAHSSHEMHMSMTFHGGYMETILFSWWKVTDMGEFMGSFLAIFIMALFYEGLKYYRKHLLWKTYTGLQYCAVAPPDKGVANICASDEPQVIQSMPHVLERNIPTMMSAAHAWQTVLHGIQVLVSYMLMLVFMTYNTWLCAAVVLGSATGYFLFGWRESVVVDFTEHCH